MFLFLLGERFIAQSQTISDYKIEPGYYKVTVKGAGGGYACDGHNYNIFRKGGTGAMITGTMHISDHSVIKAVGGDKPAWDHCYDDQYLPKTGPNGEGGNTSSRNGGSGGGYSSISVDNVLIAMAGGGGGGNLYERFGVPAGGYDVTTKNSYTYVKNSDGYNIKVNHYGTSNNHRGADAPFVDGCSAGGGGYFPGEKGKTSGSMYERLGSGGSSYLDPSYFTEYDIQDGIQADWDAYGQVIIDTVALCNSNCKDCSQSDVNHCLQCWEGYYMNNNKCEKCIGNCTKCSSKTQCSACDDGYRLEGQKCVLITPPPQTPEPVIPPQSESTTQSETVTKTERNGIDISNIGVNGGSNGQGLGNKDKNGEDGNKFPWAIVGGAVAGVVLIAIIIAIIATKSKSKPEVSPELEEANAADLDGDAAITYDNPLFTDPNRKNEDPFKDDFEAPPKSNVLDANDVEENISV